MGKIDTTLFIKLRENDILIVQIYVDDIIFGATNVSLCKEFVKFMHSEFEMSMMGELNFFLDLQIKQLKEGINKSSKVHKRSPQEVQFGRSKGQEHTYGLIHQVKHG